MHERRFKREIERLRDPERLAHLEVDRVVQLALAGVPQGRSVLDIGAGSGVFAEKFAAQGYPVNGVDANPEMVQAARERVSSGSFREGVAERLPFPDASFDVVFMGLVLHETDDPAMALREAHRVATRRLAILEWPDGDQDFGPPREDRLSDRAIVSFAKAAGFKKIEPLRLKSLILYRAER